MWGTKHLALTKEQKERGVIFSSCLIRDGERGFMHEVHATDSEAQETIARLKKNDFFKSMAKDLGWNVVHEIRQ